MGIAFDAYSDPGANSTADQSWTHTPVGTPAAAIVMVPVTTAGTVNGATYGGVSMTQEAGSPRTHTAGAADSNIHFFRLNNPTAGAQTVAVDITGVQAYRAACVTLTVDDGGTVTVDTSAGNDSGAVNTPSVTVTLATTSSTDTVCLFAWWDNEANVASISLDQTTLAEIDAGPWTHAYGRADGAGGNVSQTITHSAAVANGFAFAYKSVVTGTTASPDVIARTVTVDQVTPQASSSLTPAVIARSVTTPQASGNAGSSLTPATIARTITTPPASPSTAVSVTPATIARSFAVPQATPQTAVSVTPATIARSVVVPQAQAGAFIVVTPDAISRSVVVPQATAQASTSLTPTTIARSVTTPQAGVQAGSSITPATVARSVVIGQASASGATTIAANQAPETDLAQPISVARSFAFGEAFETDLAQPLTVSRSVTVGQATEIDTARTVAAPGEIPVEQAEETDEAQPIAASHVIGVGQASETDEAQSIAGIRPPGTGIVRSPNRVRIYAAHNEVT